MRQGPFPVEVTGNGGGRVSAPVVPYGLGNNVQKGRTVHSKHPTSTTLTRLILTLLTTPCVALAQNASPFMTGATSLESNILAWMTPIAIILVMVLGAMAMANRISWAWAIAAILGIAIVFGAPQIVTWVRGMFGV